MAPIQLDLVTRRPGSTENLHISFDQASEKAAEWALWFEVSFWIFLESPYAAWRTKVERLALIGAYHCLRVFPGDLHPAYRVYYFFFCISSHGFFLYSKNTKSLEAGDLIDSSLFGQLLRTHGPEGCSISCTAELDSRLVAF